MVGKMKPEEMPVHKVLVSGGLDFKEGDRVFRVTVEVHGIRAEDESSAIAAAATSIARQLKSRAFCADHAEVLDVEVPKTLFDEETAGEQDECDEDNGAEEDVDDEDVPV